MTTIRYFIPEDGDSELQPNVFLAPKPRQQGYPPTLGQVKQNFPLPGRYHFRFKSPLLPGADREKGAMPVWMDCVDDRQPVPAWQGAIVAKLTRIGVEDDDDDDDDADFGAHARGATQTGAPTRAPPPQQQQRQQQQQPVAAPVPAPAPALEPSMDFFGGGSSASSTPAPPSRHASTHSASSSSAGHYTGNLLDGHTPPAQAPPSGSSLLDMGTPYGHQQAAAASAGGHNDFLGMTATPSPPVTGNTNGNPFGGMSQQQQQQQGNSYNNYNQQQQQQQQGPFGGLGTPWRG